MHQWIHARILIQRVLAWNRHPAYQLDDKNRSPPGSARTEIQRKLSFFRSRFFTAKSTRQRQAENDKATARNAAILITIRSWRDVHVKNQILRLKQ
jgi:hypothetical protein